MDGPLRDGKMRWRGMKRKTIDLNGGEKGPVCLMSVDTMEDQHERKDR